MSNMSYCRFQNTLSELQDCAEHLHDAFGKGDNDRREAGARAALVRLCLELAEDLGDVEPEQLGTDADPAAAVECSECGEAERAGMVDAEGRCEGCSELLVDEGA